MGIESVRCSHQFRKEQFYMGYGRFVKKKINDNPDLGDPLEISSETPIFSRTTATDIYSFNSGVASAVLTVSGTFLDHLPRQF